MTDSSSFREVAEATVEAEVTPQETSEVIAEQGSQEAPQEVETFAETPDQKELESMTPQQLLEVKRNWEKAYTQKRQKEAQQLKEYQQKIAEYEARIQQQPQASVEERAAAAEEQVSLGNMTLEEYTAYLQQLSKETVKEEMTRIAQEQREETLAQTAMEKFSNADSRLNESSPEFDQRFKAEVQRELADLLDEHLNATGSYEGFDAAKLTKEIVDRRDQEMDEIIKKRTQQSTQAAKMREAKSKKSEVRGTTSQSQQLGGNSIRDILIEAVDSAA